MLAMPISYFVSLCHRLSLSFYFIWVYFVVSLLPNLLSWSLNSLWVVTFTSFFTGAINENAFFSLAFL